jgi:hypothetical protein
MNGQHDDHAFGDSYDKGWDEATSFIDRHPDGMPWAAEQTAPGETDAEPGAYEKAYELGWNERMDKEGWR